MRWIYKGKVYSDDQLIEIDDVVYTTRGLTATERTGFGITAVVDQPMPDTRYNFVTEDPANPGAWIATPRDVASIKTMLTDQVNAYVAAQLSPTDWMRIRTIDDPSKVMPTNIATYRNAVRDQGNVLTTEIAALADFASAVAWQPHDWPAPPTS